MRGVGGLLNLCQGGTCICDHQQNTVLYCYGEVRYKLFTNSLLPFVPLTGGVEEASSTRWRQHVTIYSGAPLPCPAGSVGHGHPAAALHALHPPLHPLHPLLPQAPGQEDLSPRIRGPFIAWQPTWDYRPRKGLVLEKIPKYVGKVIHTYLSSLPGWTSHGKWTGGERDVCGGEGTGSSLCHVFHPWIRHNMRDYFCDQTIRERRKQSKIKPMLCRPSTVTSKYEKLHFGTKQYRVKERDP